jgi:hypothetical protein
MLKRVAFLGAIAALTIWNPSHSVAQTWDGGTWGGGGWGGGCCGAITITVGFPRPRFCCRPFIPRPTFCCRPFIPRPVWCCNNGPYPYYGRPLYYYGDRFAPYGYNWNAGYTEAGYGYDDE